MEFDDKFLQEMGLSAMPEQQKQEFLDYVQKLGFPVNPYNKVCHNEQELLNSYRSLMDNRADLPYDIDGIVEKVIELLDHPDKYALLRENAREKVVADYDLKMLLYVS